MCSLWQRRLRLCSCTRGVLPRVASLLQAGCPCQADSGGAVPRFRGLLTAASEQGSEPQVLLLL